MLTETWSLIAQLHYSCLKLKWPQRQRHLLLTVRTNVVSNFGHLVLFFSQKTHETHYPEHLLYNQNSESFQPKFALYIFWPLDKVQWLPLTMLTYWFLTQHWRDSIIGLILIIKTIESKVEKSNPKVHFKTSLNTFVTYFTNKISLLDFWSKSYKTKQCWPYIS